MGLLTVLFLAGLATWIATSTIVEAEIFRDVREGFAKLYDKKPNWLTYKLRYLVQCHMCTGIWVAAVVAIWLPPLVSVPVIGWGLTALAVKGIGHTFLVLQKLFESITARANEDARWQQNVNDADSVSKENVNNVGWPEG